jgi:hypothetical protein
LKAFYLRGVVRPARGREEKEAEEGRKQLAQLNRELNAISWLLDLFPTHVELNIAPGGTNDDGLLAGLSKKSQLSKFVLL